VRVFLTLSREFLFGAANVERLTLKGILIRSTLEPGRQR